MKTCSKYKHISIQVLQIETHEKKQTAKTFWAGGRGGEKKQQIKPNLLEAAKKTPCENFIVITTLFSDQASRQVYSLFSKIQCQALLWIRHFT